MLAPRIPRPAAKAAARPHAASTPTPRAQAHGGAWDFRRMNPAAVPAQSGLVVGAVDHPLERDADRLAHAAMAGRQDARSPTAALGSAMARPDLAAPPIVADVLATQGAPLDAATSAFFGSRFGHDFASVRLHTDARAVESARALGARGYAYGDHIVLAEPPTGATHTLAHELAHIAQHGRNDATTEPGIIRRQPAAQAAAAPVALPPGVEPLLQATAEGRHALSVMRTYQVTLILTDTGRPAYYDLRGTCTLNKSLPPAVIASYFTHEMYHAEQAKTGKTGDPKKMEKDPYVTQMVNEEIEGTVRGYTAHLELERNGTLPAGTPEPPRSDSFRIAYKTGRERAQKANPAASEADLHAAGLENAKAAIRYWIKEGGLAPGPGVTYRQYYAADWDRANKTR
jgi:hypothetical protein